MKNQNIKINGSIEVHFSNTQGLDPSDVVEISKEYVQKLPLLMEYLKGFHVKLLFLRMTESEEPERHEKEGVVSNLNTNIGSFDFCFKNSEEDDIGTTVHVRTDNVLGYIPMVPGWEINPYKKLHTKTGLEYFHYLKKIREIARSCVGLPHSAILFYKHKNGDLETIFAEIKKANKSNLEFIQYKSEKGSGEKKSITLGKTEKVELNISTKKYFCGLKIHFGTKHNISPFDDGNEF